MYLTDEGLDKIEETAEKHKNVTLLFLIDIYRMLKKLLENQDNSSNSSYNRTDGSNERNNKN